MPVPSPNIAVSVIPGGVMNYLYNGPIGVAGVLQTLYVDLTAIPETIRRDKNFQDQLLLEAKSLEQGLSDIQPAILAPANFFDDGAAVNAYISLLVTSDLAARTALILVHPRHTKTR